MRRRAERWEGGKTGARRHGFLLVWLGEAIELRRRDCSAFWRLGSLEQCIVELAVQASMVRYLMVRLLPSLGALAMLKGVGLWAGPGRARRVMALYCRQRHALAHGIHS